MADGCSFIKHHLTKKRRKNLFAHFLWCVASYWVLSPSHCICGGGAKAGEWESRRKAGRRGFHFPELTDPADIETKEVLVQVIWLIGSIFLA